jgi:hypothetical protein
MSDEDKAKLGRSGSKINTAGAHLVTIVEAYEIDNQRFCLKLEDAEGKTVDWTGFFKMKVGKDDKGVVKAGEYSVNGVKTFLDTEGAEYSILKGGGKSINNVSLLQIEFGGTAIDGNFHFTNIFDFLTKRNFKCYRISFFGLIPILECSTFEEILFPTNYIFMKTQVLK